MALILVVFARVELLMRFRKFHSQPAADVGKVNVTPMIDVIMVLIVFYLIVGRLAVDQSARVQLPASFAGSLDAQRGLTLAILPSDIADAPPVILLEGQPISRESLVDALRVRMPELANGKQLVPLHLRADKRLTYGAVQPVIDACRQAGVLTIKLVAARDASQQQLMDIVPKASIGNQNAPAGGGAK